MPRSPFSFVDHDGSRRDADTEAGVGLGMGPLADSLARNPRSSSTFTSGSDTPSAPSIRRLLVTARHRADHIVTVTARMKDTPTCLGVYISLMLLNMFVLFWEISGRYERRDRVERRAMRDKGR
jgi:hypothetical protein